MKPKLTEKQIENSILQWLNLNGIFAFKINTTGIYDPTKNVFRSIQNKYIQKGCADILGVLPGGRFLAIEVKTPTTIKRFLNRPTDADKRQIKFLDTIERKRGIGIVVSCLEEVTIHLEEFVKR